MERSDSQHSRFAFLRRLDQLGDDLIDRDAFGFGVEGGDEAVAEGRLDVAQVFEPLVSRLTGEGRAHVWHVAASRGPTAYTTFTTTVAKLHARRTEFKAMLRGLAKTLAWVADNPAEALAETVAPYFRVQSPCAL